MTRLLVQLWKKRAFDLGVLGIALVLGCAVFLLLTGLSGLSGAVTQFEVSSVDLILLILPEDQTAARVVGIAVGLIVVIGGYSEVSKARVLLGMASVAMCLVCAMVGIVGLLLPHFRMIATLNSGPYVVYPNGGDSYQVDDILWIVVMVCLVIGASLLKRRNVKRGKASPNLSAMIAVGFVLSVMAFSWSLLGVLASADELLHLGLGGQKLPMLTELAIVNVPDSGFVRGIVTVSVGLVLGIGFSKRSFGAFPRYFSAIALAIFLLCCAIQMFMVVPYYEVYAADVGARSSFGG